MYNGTLPHWSKMFTPGQLVLGLSQSYKQIVDKHKSSPQCRSSGDQSQCSHLHCRTRARKGCCGNRTPCPRISPTPCSLPLCGTPKHSCRTWPASRGKSRLKVSLCTHSPCSLSTPGLLGLGNHHPGHRSQNDRHTRHLQYFCKGRAADNPG